MKTIILPETKELFEIIDAAQKDYMESLIKPLQRYHKDFISSSYDYIVTIQDLIIVHKHYINMFFKAIDYLYQYHHEFDPIFFDLLNFAATNLERLSQEKIAALSIDEEKEASRSELGDYLDKVTLIFQTAADKAADKRLRKTYAAKAQEYSRKADAAHHVVSTQSYNEKILSLYGKVISERPEGSFIKGVLKKRAAEYQRKCEAKEMPDSLVREREARTASLFSPFEETETTEGASDTMPLLGSHRESADGLRRRTVRREEERPTSTPSPS